jgi:hypothetical protein
MTNRKNNKKVAGDITKLEAGRGDSPNPWSDGGDDDNNDDDDDDDDDGALRFIQ